VGLPSRLELNQLGAQLELISAEKAVMHKSNADLATRAEVLASQLRALEQKARLASSLFTSSVCSLICKPRAVFPHQGGELKQHALKSVEETQGVLQQNDRLMGEVLSLLASIMRLTEGMAGVEDIHASAEGLLCDQKTLHTELAAFLEQVAELLADKLSAQAIIPAEPFLVRLAPDRSHFSFFPSSSSSSIPRAHNLRAQILVQQFVAAVEYLYHQCVAVGFSFKSIASAQMEDVEHNPRAEDKKESAASAATSTEEAAPPPEENGVYEEDDEDEEEVDDEEEEEGEEDEGREHGPASARKDPERVFPSFSRLPIGAWATVPLQQTHGSAVGQESGTAPPFIALSCVPVPSTHSLGTLTCVLQALVPTRHRWRRCCRARSPRFRRPPRSQQPRRRPSRVAVPLRVPRVRLREQWGLARSATYTLWACSSGSRPNSRATTTHFTRATAASSTRPS
jgi:hypothetical protein